MGPTASAPPACAPPKTMTNGMSGAMMIPALYRGSRNQYVRQRAATAPVGVCGNLAKNPSFPGLRRPPPEKAGVTRDLARHIFHTHVRAARVSRAIRNFRAAAPHAPAAMAAGTAQMAPSGVHETVVAS